MISSGSGDQSLDGHAPAQHPLPMRIPANASPAQTPRQWRQGHLPLWRAIRSAAYCLGALQGLDLGGLVGQARWIVGVSGDVRSCQALRRRQNAELCGANGEAAAWLI